MANYLQRTPGRTRTFDLRIRNPIPEHDKSLPEQALTKAEGERMLKISDTDSELRAVCEAWPGLPEHIRRTIAQLAKMPTP
jgi:hypothetical protein